MPVPKLTHVTHGSVCLGKNRPKRSLKILSLSNYVHAEALAAPLVCAWERPESWGMLGNDTVGDCTIAAALHLRMLWQSVANAGTPLSFSTQDALDDYSAITGYNPADPNTDQGAVETDVLNYWKATGLQGDKILGYASIDIQNIDQVKAATFIFGGLYIGLNVPAYIMNVPAEGSWSQPSGADTTIEGGHAVPVVGYGRAGARIVSWGTTYTFNWEFWQNYVEEAYALVDNGWLKYSGMTPSGLNLHDLLADLGGV